MRQLFLIEGGGNPEAGQIESGYRLVRLSTNLENIILAPESPFIQGDYRSFERIETLLEQLGALLDGQPRSTSKTFSSAKMRTLLKKNARKNLLERINEVLFAPDGNSSMNYDELARSLNISRSSLQKQVKQLTGQSLSHAVIKIRIDFAKELLFSSNYSVKEIANLCGFKTQVYFQVSFKKLTGITPTEFQHRANAHTPQTAASN